MEKKSGAVLESFSRDKFVCLPSRASRSESFVWWAATVWELSLKHRKQKMFQAFSSLWMLETSKSRLENLNSVTEPSLHSINDKAVLTMVSPFVTRFFFHLNTCCGSKENKSVDLGQIFIQSSFFSIDSGSTTRRRTRTRGSASRSWRKVSSTTRERLRFFKILWDGGAIKFYISVTIRTPTWPMLLSSMVGVPERL